MSPSGAEVLRQIKSRIEEVDPAAVREQVSNGAVVVDVREVDEWGSGHVPGAKHVPKSYLESRIEGAAPDRSQHVILYCQSGNRSAWAARTLIEDLGYENVESMTGGFTLWKDRGYDVETPRTLTAEQRERYSRHLLLPEVGVEGQQKLLDAKVLLLGAGGLGSPTALYLAAAGVGTLGIVDNDEVVPWREIPIPRIASLPKFDRWNASPSGGPDGYVVATRDDLPAVGGGYVLFTDLGSAKGLRPGNVLRIYREQQQGLPRLMLGQGVVVEAEQETSAVKVAVAVKEIKIGDRVELER